MTMYGTGDDDLCKGMEKKNIGLESTDCLNMKPPLAVSVKMVLVNIIEATCVAVGCR